MGVHERIIFVRSLVVVVVVYFFFFFCAFIWMAGIVQWVSRRCACINSHCFSLLRFVSESCEEKLWFIP